MHLVILVHEIVLVAEVILVDVDLANGMRQCLFGRCLELLQEVLEGGWEGLVLAKEQREKGN